MAYNYPIPAEGAVKLELSLIATSSISKLDLVKLDSNTHCSRANFTSSQNASVIGVALNSAIGGNTVKVLLFGILEDPSLLFALNDLLFLKSDSTITDIGTSTTGDFLVVVGKSLGTGAIFVNVSTPEEII